MLGYRSYDVRIVDNSRSIGTIGRLSLSVKRKSFHEIANKTRNVTVLARSDNQKRKARVIAKAYRERIVKPFLQLI